MIGDHCRSGCKEKSHASYAECLRAARPSAHLFALEQAGVTRDERLYRRARAEGIQPAGTTARQTLEATAFSDRYGVAYDAGNLPGTLERAGLMKDTE